MNFDEYKEKVFAERPDVKEAYAAPEYIDRKLLFKYPIRINHYDKENGNEHFVYGIESVLEYAEQIPVADVAPVIHGRWIPDGNTVCCSECKTMGSPQWRGCPVCLARMDCGENEN